MLPTAPGGLCRPWLRGYRRAWLRPDVIAGVVVWSVVVTQAVAYAQIAGLPPQAGLMAAPGALVGYALLGTSRTLVVGATTATAALSASAVGPPANGDAERFVQLSAALAVVTAVVLVCSGLLRLGAVADLISKPVMTGFLFGLGLTIAVGQLPKVLGVDDPGGDFFPRLWGVLGELGDRPPLGARRVERVLGAVGVVELALGRRNVVRATLGSHAIDEADDRGAGRSLRPGGEVLVHVRRGHSPGLGWVGITRKGDVASPAEGAGCARSHRRAVRQANSGGARERSRSNRLSQPRDGP